MELYNCSTLGFFTTQIDSISQPAASMGAEAAQPIISTWSQHSWLSDVFGSAASVMADFASKAVNTQVSIN